MTDSSRAGATTVIAAGRIITGAQDLTPGWLEVQDDRILEVGAGLPPRTADLRFPSMTMVPGFVDTHVHGGGGACYSTDRPDEAVAVTRSHLSRGTTSHVASLVTAPLPQLARQVSMLSELVDDGTLAGIHLEGPWLNRQFKGAHSLRDLRSPTSSDLAKLLRAGGGTIRMVTLAPELEGGLDAIRRVVDAGAVAAIGHTGADYGTVRTAIDAGATVATHLFNAMPPVHHRDPGPVVALMEDERVAVELILDGHHMHPSAASLAMRSAAGGFHLVTDAMAAAGYEDGRYTLGARNVDVHQGVATLEGTQTLAGSTLTMDAAVRGAVAAGQSLRRAVQAATMLPAVHLSLSGVGQLAAGYRADLVLMDGNLVARRTMRAGRWLELPEPTPSDR